ncbi:MAG: hypothetical protein WD335_03640 [Candidatus Paceibacterota bacterium]
MNKLNKLNILILEDDTLTLSVIYSALDELAEERDIEFKTMQFSSYLHVEGVVNKLISDTFDLVLLDRDCIDGKSFHIIDFKKFGVDKMISISSNPEWNENALREGVAHVVQKDFRNMNAFKITLKEAVNEVIKI